MEGLTKARRETGIVSNGGGECECEWVRGEWLLCDAVGMDGGDWRWSLRNACRVGISAGATRGAKLSENP